MPKEHVGVSYQEDECLITLFCECEDCSIPLAEIDNGCQCEYSSIRKYKFIDFSNDITLEEATSLLNTLKSKTAKGEPTQTTDALESSN